MTPERKAQLELHNGLLAALSGSAVLAMVAKLVGLSVASVAPIAAPLGLAAIGGLVWYGRGSGIPNMVKPHQPDPDKGFAVMVGRTSRGRPVWFSLGRTSPHMMSAGSTGYGKTAFLEYVLYTIAHQTQKFDLKIIDLKEKASFARWARLPFCSEVVGDPKEAQRVLEEARDEMRRRLRILNEARYNFQDDPYFEPLIVVVDEGSILSRYPDALEPLHDIAVIGREPRVHLVYCTQHPSYKIIPVEVRDQFGARFVFHLDEQSGSEVALGNGDHRAFETLSVPGRCIYKAPRVDLEMQVPYIPTQQIVEWIKDMADTSGGSKTGLSSQAEQGVLPGF